MDQESGTSRLRDRDPPISTSCAFIYALVLIFSLLRSISNEARVARDRSYRRSPRVCTLLIYLFLRGRAIRKWQVVVLTRENRNSFNEIVEKYFRLVSPVCLHFFFLVVFLGKKKNNLSSFRLFVRRTSKNIFIDICRVIHAIFLDRASLSTEHKRPRNAEFTIRNLLPRYV